MRVESKAGVATAAAIAAMLGGVEVTVSYEALDAAASEVLSSAAKTEAQCNRLRDLNDRLKAIWEGEASELYVQQIKEVVEGLEMLIRQFRTHAQNLQKIAAQYVKTSKEIQGSIEPLSSDVIV